MSSQLKNDEVISQKAKFDDIVIASNNISGVEDIEVNNETTLKGNLGVGASNSGVSTTVCGNILLKSATGGTTGGNLELKNTSNEEVFKVSDNGMVSTYNDLNFKSTTYAQSLKAWGNVSKTLTLKTSVSTLSSPPSEDFTENIVLRPSSINTNGNLIFNAGVNDYVKFKRGSAGSAYTWTIEGSTNANNSSGTNRLLTVYRNALNSDVDSVSYDGKSTGALNIQNKTSTQALIDASIAASGDILKGGEIFKTGGSGNTTGNLTIKSADSTSGNVLILDSSSNTITKFHRTGEIEMGNQLKLGNTTTLTSSNKTIDVVATSSPAIKIRTSTDGSTFSDKLIVDTAQTKSTVKYTCTGNNTSSQAGDVEDSPAQLKFDASGNYAHIWKTGSTTSNNNQFRIYCGTNNSSANSGVRFPMASFQNQNGTYVCSLVSSTSAAIDNLRQQYDNEIVVMKTLKTTNVNITSPTVTTTSSTDSEGNTQFTTTQSAGTVGANLTFTGANIHDGVTTHNGIFHSKKSLRLENCEDAETSNSGAMALKWKNTTTANNSAHILFQGSGTDNAGANPGTFTFARDGATNNVSDSDKYFLLTAPKGDGAGVKTTFVQPIEVPTPTADAHASTKAYVDSQFVSGGAFVTAEGSWTCTLEARNIGSGVSPANPSPKKTAVGHYVRMGKVVRISVSFSNISTVGYTGQAVLTGLPFTAKNSIGAQILPIWNKDSLINQNNHGDDGFYLAIQQNTSEAYVYNTQINPLNPATIVNSSSAFIVFSGSYIIE